MPLLDTNYRSPLFLRNGHVSTIVPSLWRKVEGVIYQRERIITPDDDFLDLDWLKQGGSKVVILSHGLEGSSQRPYVLGAAALFYARGWDVVAWNCRSCSGEINRQPRFYHHGETEDLAAVVRHVQEQHYTHIFLTGFSLGGSMTIKFLSEMDDRYGQVVGGMAASVPLELADSVKKFETREMAFYRRRFLKKLEQKVKIKAEKYPGMIHYENFDNIKHFTDFDNTYTAPLHGFDDAHDFYDKASANRYLADVKRPLLLINALNDPFLTPSCFPVALANAHHRIHLETPKYGGHVGFSQSGKNHTYLEERAYSFAEQIFM